MKTIIYLLMMVCVLGACKGMKKSQKGVLIGAAAGGAAGAGIGKAAGNTALGAIIGATVGGVAGGIIGHQMDKQAEELEKIPGAEVKRVGEGVNVTFDSGVLFDYAKHNLSADAKVRISEVAEILNKYPDTYVLVEGHTDATGSESYNLTLSKRRAQSVTQLLTANDVKSQRIKSAWYGESQPKFPNDSEMNRGKNRRVEFAIYANENLIRKAKEGSVDTK